MLSSEGGHIGISCFNDEIYELSKYIKEQRGSGEEELLSAEHMFCGLGIPLIYRFFRQKLGLDDTPDILGEEIFAKVKEGGDEAADKTYVNFVKILAATCQSLSASICPENGLILCGNIIRCVIDKFLEDTRNQDSQFFKIFTNNKAMRSFLELIPIYFCNKKELGLFGCKVSSPINPFPRTSLYRNLTSCN